MKYDLAQRAFFTIVIGSVACVFFMIIPDYPVICSVGAIICTVLTIFGIVACISVGSKPAAVNPVIQNNTLQGTYVTTSDGFNPIEIPFAITDPIEMPFVAPVVVIPSEPPAVNLKPIHQLEHCSVDVTTFIPTTNLDPAEPATPQCATPIIRNHLVKRARSNYVDPAVTKAKDRAHPSRSSMDAYSRFSLIRRGVVSNRLTRLDPVRIDCMKVITKLCEAFGIAAARECNAGVSAERERLLSITEREFVELAMTCPSLKRMKLPRILVTLINIGFLHPNSPSTLQLSPVVVRQKSLHAVMVAMLVAFKKADYLSNS